MGLRSVSIYLHVNILTSAGGGILKVLPLACTADEKENGTAASSISSENCAQGKPRLRMGFLYTCVNEMSLN